MNVDPVAQTAYGREAKVYERVRPSYPPDAIAWLTRELGLRGGVTVVDVGAGTGKLTRALAETGARVVAVEPVPEMAARLREIDVDVVVAAAEALPLSDASADAITVAQALHWFDLSRALAEFARVLRSDGLLALAWNRPDVQDPLQAGLAALLRGRGSRTDPSSSARTSSESRPRRGSRTFMTR